MRVVPMVVVFILVLCVAVVRVDSKVVAQMHIARRRRLGVFELS